jgi:glutamyl-tRNA reductase
MDLLPEEEAAVERMSRALVNKLLHGPIQEIKALAEAGSPLESAEVRRRLLALDDLEVELHRSRPESP